MNINCANKEIWILIKDEEEEGEKDFDDKGQIKSNRHFYCAYKHQAHWIEYL